METPVPRALHPIALLVLAAACAEPASAPQTEGSTGGPITDEATFRREIVGRELTAISDRFMGTVVLDADGAMRTEARSPDGETLFNRMQGTWSFEDGEFCRTLEVLEGSSSSPASECQRVALNGDVVDFSPRGRPPSTWRVGDA